MPAAHDIRDPVPQDDTATIVQAIARAFELWELSNQQSADLLDIPIATWNRMKAGQFRGRLDADKRMRASLIVGLFKGLRLYFNGPLTFGWPRLANSGVLFAGRSPLAFMIEGGIPAMMKVRRHIDGLRGGL